MKAVPAKKRSTRVAYNIDCNKNKYEVDRHVFDEFMLKMLVNENHK